MFTILSISNAWFLSQRNTLPDTAVHCGIEMWTCTLTVPFTLKQNALKLFNISVILVIQNVKPMLSMGFYSNIWSF